jgi:hypothetical protein
VQQVRQTVKIEPLRPVEELRSEALKAKLPVETGDFLKPDLVELVKLDPRLKLDPLRLDKQFSRRSGVHGSESVHATPGG